jgi:hypothetical protein
MERFVIGGLGPQDITNPFLKMLNNPLCSTFLHFKTNIKNISKIYFAIKPLKSDI